MTITIPTNHHVPGIASACWVSAEEVNEGQPVWLTIGAQRIALAKTGTADADGWRPIWWFSEGLKLPLCLCLFHEVKLHPTDSDGTDDYHVTLKAKWEYEEPTEHLRSIIEDVARQHEENVKNGGFKAGYTLPPSESVDVPLTFPGNSSTKHVLTFASGVAGLNYSGKGCPDDPDFYNFGISAFL